ncbi:hypothetical protein [Microbacterium radiodurans]|uniref:Uncharacterized protein n=1 Tax=Microbacterium radiodurans TaxID=661398 RepID=A0A5J5IQZ1_9MICO|nr:hypothetical protein [Microbacterium radiodurans]KAA9087056.1 hypothetical protein F6B42_08840 [Microbacterium radiodurans]
MHTAIAAPALALRAVAPPEVPFPGVLSATHPVRYRVIAGDAPAVVAIASAGGHVLAAEDVDDVDGSAVLVLPPLRGRLAYAPGVALDDAGVAVTLLVSVLRGVREADRWGIAVGEWWVTDDGRPVLVPRGEESVETVSRRLVAPLVDSAACGEVVADALGRLVEGELDDRTLAELEERLFAIAAPEPLPATAAATATDTGAAAPGHGHVDRRRGEPSTTTRRTERVRRGSGHGVTPADPGRALAHGVGALVARGWDHDLGRRAAESSDIVLRALRRASAARRFAASRSAARRPAGRPRRRMRLAVTAVAAMGVTVALGVAVTTEPTAGAGEAAPPVVTTEAAPLEDPPVERVPPGVPAAERGPTTDAGIDPAVGTDLDPAAGAHRAIAELSRCHAAEEAACRARILERPDAVIPPGLVTDGDQWVVTLLDDLGGVTVVRVEDAEGVRPPQIVVLVDHDGKRLVRDVYDVADQP